MSKESQNTSDIITAPFTDEQVETLNLSQTIGIFHEYTCAGKIHAEASPNLIATKNGWKCTDSACDYTQNYAEAFRADHTYIEGLHQVMQQMYPNK